MYKPYSVFTPEFKLDTTVMYDIMISMKAKERNKKCEECEKVFYNTSDLGITRWTNARFCSKGCAAKTIHIGQKPWCLGLTLTEEHKRNISIAKKGKHYSPTTEIKKGQRISPATEFKKGQIPWNWKGDLVGYNALHSWVKRKLGRPNICWFCKSTIKSRYDWANKSGEYKRDLSDWIRLCVKCHRNYDIKRRLNV